MIGDNQKFGAIKNTVVIGTINKPEEDIVQKHNSVVVGYNARSGTKTGGSECSRRLWCRGIKLGRYDLAGTSSHSY